MVIKITHQLEAVLTEQARCRGIAPEALAVETLSEKFLNQEHAAAPQLVEPQDEWEKKLFGSAINCGVSFPDKTLSSDGLYD